MAKTIRLFRILLAFLVASAVAYSLAVHYRSSNSQSLLLKAKSGVSHPVPWPGMRETVDVAVLFPKRFILGQADIVFAHVSVPSEFSARILNHPKQRILVRARVLSLAFDIQPITDEAKSVLPGAMTEWGWNVLPRYPGVQPVEIILSVERTSGTASEIVRDYLWGSTYYLPIETSIDYVTVVIALVTGALGALLTGAALKSVGLTKT